VLYHRLHALVFALACQLKALLGGTIPLEIIFDDLAEDYWYDEDLRADIHKIHGVCLIS
jgi:hypothetical protein